MSEKYKLLIIGWVLLAIGWVNFFAFDAYEVLGVCSFTALIIFTVGAVKP